MVRVCSWGDDRLRGGRGGVGGCSLVDGGAVSPADAESAGSQVATVLTCAWTDGSQVLGRTVELGLPDLHALVRRAGDPVGLRRFAWSRQVCGTGGSLVLRQQLVPSARYGAGGRSCIAAAARARRPVRRCIAAAARTRRRRAAQVGDRPLVGEGRRIPPRGRERVADLRDRAAAPFARSFEQDVRVLPGRHAGSLVPGRRRSGAHPRGRTDSTL